MQGNNTPTPSGDGPGLERAITLTDAVVAIAMTLLVLPLVEVAREVDTDHVRSFLNEHWDLLLSFAVSFLVIYVFWAAHDTAYRQVGEAGVEVPALKPLNMWWLLIIAFLPFPTAVVGRDLNTTTAPIYIGTMFVLSTLTSAMIMVAARAAGSSARAMRTWLTTAVFALCTLLSMLNAELGMLSLLLIVVVRIIEVRVLDVPAATSTPSSSSSEATSAEREGQAQR